MGRRTEEREKYSESKFFESYHRYWLNICGSYSHIKEYNSILKGKYLCNTSFSKENKIQYRI